MEIPSIAEVSTSSSKLWELFVWSIVFDLPDLARVLWPYGDDQIAKALVATNFYRRQANQEVYSDRNNIERIRENNIMFNAYACKVLADCYKMNSISATKMITKNLVHFPGKTCLTLAVEFKNYDFVAHPCVQTVLTDVWTGYMSYNKLQLQELTTLKGYLRILLGILFPFLIGVLGFEFRNNEDPKYGRREVKNRFCSALRQVYTFYGTPVVGFFLHSIFNVIFLSIYSYIIIVEGKQDAVTPLEWIIYTMVLGYFTSEIYQVSQYEGRGIFDRMCIWMSDFHTHNFWDLFNLFLFVVAVGLKFHTLTNPASHTIHSVNCAFWILRLTTGIPLIHSAWSHH